MWNFLVLFFSYQTISKSDEDWAIFIGYVFEFMHDIIIKL